jgi:hypothetical protein
MNAVDHHVGEVAHAAQFAALQVEGEDGAGAARSGIARPFAGADDVDRLVVGGEVSRFLPLITPASGAPTAATIPAPAMTPRQPMP